MANYSSFFMLLLIGSFTSQIHSSCMRGALVSETSRYGNINQYCVYNNLKVLPGSSFQLSAPDCLECKCSTEGLQCCGFGAAAGIVSAPEGCIAHNDACNLIFVKEDTPSEICHQPINKAKKSRKLPINRKA